MVYSTANQRSVFQRLIRWLPVVIIVLLLLVFVGSWLMASALVKPTRFDVGDLPEDLPGQTIQLVSASGATLTGWDIPAPNTAQPDDTNLAEAAGSGVIVLLHGIRGSRISMRARARWLHSLGYATVLIDFQAHATSSGDHITIGYRERHDVLAVVDYVTQTYPGQPLGMIAVSMGGAAALLAQPRAVDALVIESTYPDLERAVYNRVARRLGRLAWLPTQMLLWQLEPRLGFGADDLRPVDAIGQWHSPILVLSGEDDPFTPAHETRELYNAANSPKSLWLVPGAVHENLFKAETQAYQSRVAEFFKRWLR